MKKPKAEMKNSPAFVIGTIVLVGFSVFLIDYFRAFNSYNRFRDAADTPVMEAAPMTRKDQRFLDHVQADWIVLREENFGGYLLLCDRTGFEPTVEGLVELFTHEAPPFSYWDKAENIREVERAAALSVTEIATQDGKIYFKEGVAFIKCQDNLVEVYEDRGSGTWCVYYGRVDE